MAGIVLSVKSRDIITQIWLPTCKQRRRDRVHRKANYALRQHCKQPGSREGEGSIEWTWRAHPTATLREEEGRRADGTTIGGDESLPLGRESTERGICGEFVGTAKQTAGMCGIQ